RTYITLVFLCTAALSSRLLPKLLRWRAPHTSRNGFPEIRANQGGRAAIAWLDYTTDSAAGRPAFAPFCKKHNPFIYHHCCCHIMVCFLSRFFTATYRSKS
ncbi:unnamed protein product, partial [Ectocarpus sp. 12 AP-2014]